MVLRFPQWLEVPTCVLLAATACSRSETQRDTTPEPALTVASSAMPSTTTALPVHTPPANACVVPTPEKPPPVADPAPADLCPKDPEPVPALPHVFISFPDAPGAPRVSVEQALTDEQRERGLMYRQELGDDDGMIFTWPSERIRSFWMHNTCIPLDMLFIAADGTIAGILEQVPVLNDAPRGVRCPAEHVLEMNAGWTRKNGVVAGQRVQIES